MRRRRGESKQRNKRVRTPFKRFRKLGYQSLEQRMLLDSTPVDGLNADDADLSWLEHFNDDQASLQYLDSASPSEVAQTSEAAPAQTGTPAQIGQWGPLMQWPVEFINAIMLPTGEVMGWDRLMNIRLWNPTTGAITIPTSPGYNIFCTGMSLLADGEVLVTGGHVDNLTGLPFASIYNPFTDTWKPLPNLNAGRWYPSSTTLANGDVLILSGQTNDTGVDDPLPQVFDVTTDSWIDLNNALQELPLYPRTFSAPNGDAFVAGPQQLSEYLDVTGGGQWIPVAERIQPDRSYGSAVMYAPGQVLYVGGGSPASNSAEIINLNDPDPQWQEVSPMEFARRNCNATLLPDGEVLITGGNTGSGNYDGDPVMAAEIWNPTTQTFSTVASESDIRWYHSTALLLPNGQVLSGSGDNHLTEQVYSPSYLFEGAQPTITSAPGTVMYGDNFFVGTPDASTITSVTWVRLGTATHAQNWDQYTQTATFSQTTGGLIVSAPPTPNSAPPGYYMLFINRGDVPSVAKFVQVSLVAPSMTVDSPSVTEPASGSTTTVTFDVTLPLSADQTVSVNYSTADITAKAGVNYLPGSGTLTFAPGVTDLPVTITILNDNVNDPNLTFALNLTSPTGVLLQATQAIALIRDHKALPVLDISSLTMQEGNSGTTNANFIVTLSSPQSTAVSVAYTTIDGTATSGKDYIPQASTLTFAPGTTQMTISVPVIGDTIPEPHNWFFVNLSSPVGATLDIAQGKAFIYNDDNNPFISLPSTATIVEPAAGGTAYLSITATLSGPSYETVTDGWQTLADGTAVDGVNFVGQFGELTFPPLVTSVTITVPILGDGINTPDLTFSIQLQASLFNATFGTTATEVTITNSDLLPGIMLLNASAAEGQSGTSLMTFTATLTNAVGQSVSVAYVTSPGTATAGSDYTTTTGILTFPANTTTATFTVPIIGDTVPESDETFNVTLSNPVGAKLLVAKAVGTILDDDGAPDPTAPTLTGTAAFGSAVLAWPAVTGATSYNIYRSTTLNGEGTTPLVTGVTGTTYTDNGLTNGSVYYYVITAVTTQNAVAYEGPASNEVSVIPTSYSFPYFFTKQSYNFSTFTTPQSNLLSLNGDNIENMGLYGYNLQLTDGGTDETDSAFTLDPVNISRFTTQFQFTQQMSYNWNNPTGGGLTFTIQNAGPTAIGATDDGLGYAGIGQSVAIKFDLFDDAGEGSDSTGLYTDGADPTSANSIDLSGSGINLHSGDPFNVGMSYDGTTLSVTITDSITQATATQSYAVNIPGLVAGNMAYVGFTASTESNTAVQTINSWTLTPAPNAPSGLQASANGAVVNLSWTNNDANATGIVIERKTGLNGTYAPIATINTPTTTTYNDNNAYPNTTYYYLVLATDNGTTSVASNEVHLTTGASTLTADLQVTDTDGLANIVAGTAVSYTIVVTNAGPSTVTGAAIADTLPASATWTASSTGGASGFWGSAIGSIANTVTMPAGSTITYVVSTFVPVTTTGSISNTATVSVPASVTDPNLANNTATDIDTVAQPVNPQADIQITDTDGQTSVIAGSANTYTIVVTNPGPNTVVGATIADTLPAAATWTATATGDASGFAVSALGSINSTVTMPPGSVITYVVSLTVPIGATGTYSNTATIGVPAGFTDPNLANNTATDTDTVIAAGTPVADLQVTISDSQTLAVPGTTITYAVVVTNAGPSTVTGAVITAAFPASATWSATGSGGSSGFWSSAFGSINNTVNMPPNSSITYVVNTLLSITASGTLISTAAVTAPSGTVDPNLNNNTATDTDQISPPPANPTADLQITVNDGQTVATPGAAISYTIVASNAGPNTIVNAAIADNMPAGLTAVSWTATASGDASGFWGSSTGNIANTVTMPPGSTITYTVTATVSPTATGTLANTATITLPSGATDTNPANNSATDTDTVATQSDLQVTITDGQTSATPGMPITYTIVVTNAGPNAVTGAAVVDTLPSTLTGATYTATTVGGATGFTASGTGSIADSVAMPSGSTITYIVSAIVLSTATGSLANTATVAAPAGTTDPNTANNSATDTDTLGPQADLQVTITDGQTAATPGMPITYTIVVTNAGPSSVTGATVADTLPTTLTGATYTATTVGGATGFSASGSGNIANTVTMPAGSTITYIVKATVSSTATGSLANAATVAAPVGTTDPNTANNSATDTDTLGPQADLQVTITDGQTSATPGMPITYTIVVTNAGPSSVTGATVADTLPTTLTGATYTATTVGGATGFSASGSGNIANTVTMPAGSTITYIVKATVSSTATGSLVNTATVAAPAGTTDPNTANNSATDTDTLSGTPTDLQLTITDGQTTVVPGAAVTYTIVVTNAGPNAVTGAMITDTLPAVFSNVSFTATATGDASGFWASAPGNLANTVTMPVGSTITYLVHATVSSTATGSVANSATVTAPAGITDTNPANNTATDTDTVGAPQADLQVSITDGQASVVPGAGVTYTVVVTNVGPSTVTGATIADTLPATYSNVSFTATATGGASGFWGSASGSVANTVTMPPASTITYLVHATVSPAVTGSIADTATVTAPSGVTDTNLANNTATDTDTIAAPQADLQIGVTDGQTTVVPGAAVSYTVVITNVGPSNANGVVITDTLPSTYSNISFTATATGGASGFWASATGNLNNTVNMPVGGTITYVMHATLSSTATGTISDTAQLTVPSGVTDPNLTNNTATDADTVVVGVASTTPASGATGVLTTTTITATFSAAMNASTITASTFELFDSTGKQVAGTVSYNATTKVVTFKPSAPLSKSSTYTMRIVGGTSGVKDANGNTLPANDNWSFTTGTT